MKEKYVYNKIFKDYNIYVALYDEDDEFLIHQTMNDRLLLLKCGDDSETRC